MNAVSAMNKTPSFISPFTVTLPLTPGPDEQMVSVSAADVGQLGCILQLLAPVLHELMALPDDLLQRLLSEDGPTKADIVTLLVLLAEKPEIPQQFVAIAARMEPRAVTALMPDAFAYLFAVCVQVNADFFARALPAFRQAAELIALAGSDLPAEPISAAQATPGPTSLTR